MRDYVTRARGTAFLETLFQDLKYAARGLRRSPGFTLVASMSIALGVAANATVFSIVNAALLRPVPGATSDGLVRMYVNHHSPFDLRDLVWLRDHATSFRDIVGEWHNAASFRAAAGADAESAQVSYVARGFFPALGVRMALGRAFDAAESSVGGAPVAVLGYAFWQGRFGGDSAVIGRTIDVAEHPVTIIGVASPDFRSSVWGWTPDFWLSARLAPMITGIAPEQLGGSFYTTARLQSGVTQAAATAELRVLMQQLARTDSVRYDGMTVRLDDVRGVNAEL